MHLHVIFSFSVSNDGEDLQSESVAGMPTSIDLTRNEQNSRSSLKIDSDADDENSDDNREEDDKLLDSDSSSLG